jgi:hypothetical protein
VKERTGQCSGAFSGTERGSKTVSGADGIAVGACTAIILLGSEIDRPKCGLGAGRRRESTNQMLGQTRI